MPVDSSLDFYRTPSGQACTNCSNRWSFYIHFFFPDFHSFPSCHFQTVRPRLWPTTWYTRSVGGSMHNQRLRRIHSHPSTLARPVVAAMVRRSHARSKRTPWTVHNRAHPSDPADRPAACRRASPSMWHCHPVPVSGRYRRLKRRTDGRVATCPVRSPSTVWSVWTRRPWVFSVSPVVVAPRRYPDDWHLGDLQSDRRRLRPLCCGGRGCCGYLCLCRCR